MKHRQLIDDNSKRAEMPLDETITRPLIEKIIRLMDTKCVRFNGTAPDWRALFSEQLDDITRSKSSTDFEIRVNSVLSRGGAQSRRVLP
jgi:hypothetical protein